MRRHLGSSTVPRIFSSISGHSVSVTRCGRVSVETVLASVDKVSVPLIVSECCLRTQCPHTYIYSPFKNLRYDPRRDHCNAVSNESDDVEGRIVKKTQVSDTYELLPPLWISPYFHSLVRGLNKVSGYQIHRVKKI